MLHYLKSPSMSPGEALAGSQGLWPVDVNGKLKHYRVETWLSSQGIYTFYPD